jgi:hypothetical protein
VGSTGRAKIAGPPPPAFGEFLDREVRSLAELVDAPDLARDAQGADRCHGEQAHAQLVGFPFVRAASASTGFCASLALCVPKT